MAVERINLIGVPVDVCRPEQLESQILEILAKPGTKQIVFLSVWDLLKARNKRKNFIQCLQSSDLILPISKSIINGAKYLRKSIPIRYNPFSTMITILSILDRNYKSIYLLGSHKKFLLQAERNVHATFPNLQIVGRYAGYYPRKVENNVVEAIYKSSPALVLLSDGIREKNMWAYNRRNSFSSSLFLYYKDALAIFSDRIKHVSDALFDKGMEIFPEIARKPFKIFLLFPYMYYKVLLFFSKHLKKNQK